MSNKLESPFRFIMSDDYEVDEFGGYHFKMHRVFREGIGFYSFCLNPTVSRKVDFGFDDIRTESIKEFYYVGKFNERQRDFVYRLFGRDFEHSLGCAEESFLDAQSFFRRRKLKKIYKNVDGQEISKDLLLRASGYLARRAGENIGFLNRILNDSGIDLGVLKFSGFESSLRRFQNKTRNYFEFPLEFKELEGLYDKLDDAYNEWKSWDVEIIRGEIQQCYNRSFNEGF